VGEKGRAGSCERGQEGQTGSGSDGIRDEVRTGDRLA
jgi:hypothetical protein